MKTLFGQLMLLTLTVLLTSCFASREEKEQRRMNAFDISGTYKVVTSSYTPMTLQIVNETDFSNVYGVITRGDFTNAESAAFARQNISLNDVEKFRTNFKFGLGKNNTWIMGGENVSDDLGASSKLYIRTSLDESLNLDQNSIEYSVSGTMHKADMILKGTITMTITSKEVVDNQIKYVLKERIEMAF